MSVLLGLVLSPCVVPASGTAADAQAVLEGVYRGDDGGLLYLSSVGPVAYGFAEHPGLGYAFVLRGTVTRDQVTGTWWDVPKGTRAQSGSLTLRVSAGGARLSRVGGAPFGPSVLTRLRTDATIDWPGPREAGFQAKIPGDYDGAFRGDDGSAHYLRETGSTLAWFAESIPKPGAGQGARPSWSTVFVASKTGPDSFEGVWVDVPKGPTRGTSKVTASRMRLDRSLMLDQVGVSRTRELSAEWALDLEAFASSLRSALHGKVVGYAFALAKHDDVVLARAGGSRQLAQDGGVRPFTPFTQSSSASTTKLVTAAALMRLLQEKGLPVTTKVAGYLPACWKRNGPEMDTLTFQSLLDHTSTLDRAVSQSACVADPYECLRKSIEAGQSGSPGYDNINYTVLRYLVPLVEDYPRTNAFFRKFRCGDAPGAAVRKLNATSINIRVSRRFEAFVTSRLLRPFGIQAGYASTSANRAYGYDFRKQGKPGTPPNERALMTGGSGGMKWSADAYARFLIVLDAGRVVPLPTVRAMKSGKLGFESAVAGAAGSYFPKNGGAGGFGSQVMTYPGRTSAYVAVNSGNNATSASLSSILRSAFDAALK